ncbi:MAG: two pore domain potassium channel family protein [Rhodobacteraceae bacterium]|nr:two pore domain potassium channel family protein [Paracoccaceae bacterium]
MKTGGLLAAMLLHNLLYPLSSVHGAGPALFYAVYAGIFVAGTFALSTARLPRLAAALSGAAVFAAGLANSYAPGRDAALAVYLTSLAYHGVMIWVLARYVFAAREVLTDVILAATTLYLVIGSAFAALYALIVWIEPDAFATASGAPLGWQQMLYYSFVTLTTVGYGDITPRSPSAQAVAAFEAIVGVLYTVILLARLVGLNASSPASGRK